MKQEKIKITLSDQPTLSFATGTTGWELAQSINPQCAKKVLAMRVDGVVMDLMRPIQKDAAVALLTWPEPDAKKVFWHSTAHLLAEALEALYPGIKLGIGPAIDQGFYYDVDFGSQVFDASHLPVVEKKMQALAQIKNRYERMEISKKEAIEFFKKKANPYKIALLQDLPDGAITFYQQGAFTDLCKGPHLPDTSPIKAIKLLNIAGAYWRGDVRNKQLTRIYGISFPQQKELKAYLTLLQEAQKRDHRKLGKALGLFAFSQQVGKGLPLWLPKGTFIKETLIGVLHRAQTQAGYQFITTPHIGHKNLYITSGHYQKYSKDAFQPITTQHAQEEFLLRPMNCPHHCEVYKSTPRSYRDLPLRLAEFGTVYRYEQHGELHGLTRTRGFTQDDAHIFCSPDQVKQELERVIDLVLYVFKQFNFKDYEVQISLRDPKTPEKYIGNTAAWDLAEAAIREVTITKGLTTTVALGEAAFYGPKLDFMVQDALQRKWQLGTVQLDYQLPARFALTYTGPNNEKYQPVMIHRAPFGSLERFIAILLEHTAGQLPLWLSFEQVAVLPLSEKYVAYAQQVLRTLQNKGIRATLDDRDERIGRKIRDAETAKIPYMLIIGAKEVEKDAVSVRKQGQPTQAVLSLQDFIAKISQDLRPPSFVSC